MNQHQYPDWELDEFIEGWSPVPKTRHVAKEMAVFLFGFHDELEKSGLSAKTLRKHLDNLWAIGYLTYNYDAPKRFSPELFADGPGWEDEYRRKFSDSEYAVRSYEATGRKLSKYVERSDA